MKCIRAGWCARHFVQKKMPDATVTCVNISSPQGGEMLKPRAIILLMRPAVCGNAIVSYKERIAAIFAEELRLMPQQDRLRIFVVG